LALEKLQNESSLLDGLLVLEAELDRAEADGIVAPLAENSDRFFSAMADPSLVPVLRDRLFRLGYLKARKESDGVDEVLINAIRRMQQEAGLTVDGWVGAQTWSALQELFAFEPSTHLERWMGQTGMTKALHRGVFLRLISLGFIPNKTTASLAPLDEPLKEWRRTLILLGAEGISNATPLYSLKLLRYLFQIDTLSRLVHESAGNIIELLDNKKKKDGKLLRRFLNCLLNIELWLLDYDRVRPNGHPLDIWRKRIFKKRPGSKRRGKWIEKDTGFYIVIQQFWKDTDFPREHGTEGEILLHCFRILVSMDADLEDAQEDKARANGIIEQVQKDQSRVMEEWENRSLWGRVWDGAKRVWRFLKRLISRAVDCARLLVRAAYQLAAKGFSLVRRTIQIFSEGFGMLLSGEIHGSSHHIVMHHNIDFDFQLFVHTETESEKIRQFMDGLKQRLISLRVSLRMLKLLVSVALTAVKVTTGPWGWWSLLRSLISFVRDCDSEDVRLIHAAYAN
jgi:hypothetical protein